MFHDIDNLPESSCVLHIGKSFYFNGDSFLEESLVCIHPDLDAVIRYMSGVRNYPILDLANPDPDTMAVLLSGADAQNSLLVVGELSSVKFYNLDQLKEWLSYGDREQFYLVDHDGIIDSQITGMKRKEAKKTKVPSVVEDMVRLEDEFFQAELVTACHSLKKLVIYLDKKDTVSRHQLFDVIELLEGIGKGDINVYAGITARYPIFFCSEPEYRAQIKQALEYRRMKDEYHTMLDMAYT